MSQEARPAGRKYVLILPVRNEAEYLEATLDCIARQTIPPAEVLVVDDGSTDETPEIAGRFAEKFPWLRVIQRADRGERKLGGGVVDAFYTGYDEITCSDFDYICKLDGDLTFPDGYFEALMVKFEEDPELGGASGKTWNPVGGTLHEERLGDEMVAGQANFWRRAAWDAIGGYVREVMWDGIVFHRARMCGYTTCSFRDESLKIIHHRLMGSSHKSIYHGRLRWGRGQWFMGTHPLYILASGVYRMRERPFLIGGALIASGYFLAAFKGLPRYEDLDFRANLRQWQLRKLHLGFLAKKG